MRLDIELTDDTDSAGPYQDLIRRVAERALQSEGLDGAYQVAISFVSDDEIRQFNAEHRGIDETTDVLSFPLVDQDAADFVLPPDLPIHLGDVAISLDQARRQAAEYGHSFERELAYLTVHGILHLLGYDHEDEAERVQMRTREEEILIEQPR